MTKALYAGSFDPITNGHIDIATRAAAFFDELIIGIYDAPAKSVLFSTEERVEMASQALAHIHNIRVEPYICLTVEFARKIGAEVLVRGLRMSSDFEWEFEMALMNRKLTPELETICLMSNLRYQFLSSTLLKEVAELKGDTRGLVPQNVAVALRKKFSLKEEVY